MKKKRRTGGSSSPTTNKCGRRLLASLSPSSLPSLPLLVLVLLLALLLPLPCTTAFKGPPLGSQRDRPSTPPSPPSTPPKVLVVGATGRVGGLVVEGLVSRGYNVVALARDPTSVAAKALAQLSTAAAKSEKAGGGTEGAVTVVRGDVTELASLMAPMRGCVACISVSGASRVTRPFTDIAGFFLHLVLRLSSKINQKKTSSSSSSSSSSPSFSSASSLSTAYPKTHPYNVNYLGTLHLLHAARLASVPKFIRVTGLSVGYSAFNPITCLLNLVISFAVRWQLAGERAIRASGIDYTVIRPGALTNEEAAPEELVVAGDGEGVPVGRVSRRDVACLCLAALESGKASNMTLSVAGVGREEEKRRRKKREDERVMMKSIEDAVALVEPSSSTSSSSTTTTTTSPLDKSSKSSLSSPPPAVRSMNDDPLWSYKILFRREGRPDLTPLQPKMHRLAVLVFVALASFLGVGLGAGVWKVGEEVARWLRAGNRPPRGLVPAMVNSRSWGIERGSGRGGGGGGEGGWGSM